jgi:hypothetical protein
MSASSEHDPRGRRGWPGAEVAWIVAWSTVPPGSTTTDRVGCDTAALLDVDGGAVARVTASVEVEFGGDAVPPASLQHRC